HSPRVSRAERGARHGFVRAERDDREVDADALALPPDARAFSRLAVRHLVLVEHGADVTRRTPAERIAPEQGEHLGGPLEEPSHEALEPDRGTIERREPHLPVEAWLVRRHARRRTPQISRLVSKLVL